MLQHIQSVLNFSAFRPEPDDPAYSWKSRFGGRKTALVHVGRSHLDFSVIDAKGKVSPSRGEQGELKEIFTVIGPLIEEEVHGGWCAVSLDNRYVISLETNLSRKKGSEDAIKIDPRSVLHARFERGKRYAVTHNPESNSSLLVSFEEEYLKKTEAMFKDEGLKIGRMFCGTYVLLRYALAATNTKKGGPEAATSALYVICCRGCVCILSQEKDNWVELRSRPEVFEDDLQPLLELLEPFRERISPAAGVVLACDEPVEGLPAKVAEMFPDRAVNDLTEPHLLANLVYRS